jgi:hypothetical protein
MEKSRDQQTRPRRIRVTLRYIEILDSKDIDTTGEFRFRFRAGVPERDELTETRIPGDPEKHLSISEHPAMNRVSFTDVLYEGEIAASESLVVEAQGEDIDRLSANDALTSYRRVFEAPIFNALGEHGPWDEGSPEEPDPEQLGDWRFAYAIEAVGADGDSERPQEASTIVDTEEVAADTGP